MLCRRPFALLVLPDSARRGADVPDQITLSYPGNMASQEEDKQAAKDVRFKTEDEEIDPIQSLEQVETITGKDKREREDLDPAAQEELKNLAMTLQKSRQQRRLENFAFEPVSLPPSRVRTYLDPVPLQI